MVQMLEVYDTTVADCRAWAYLGRGRVVARAVGLAGRTAGAAALVPLQEAMLKPQCHPHQPTPREHFSISSVSNAVPLSDVTAC